MTTTDAHLEDPHANDAAPYGGGDPYADYRGGDFPFTELVDLADRRLGAGVIAANDEFFAERENLLVRERAVFDPEHFGHKGKIMDGWETRRRAAPTGPTPSRRPTTTTGPSSASAPPASSAASSSTPPTSAATTRSA